VTRARKSAKASLLNARQLRFVEEYVVDLNATQAAIRAGYSAKTASQSASRLLRHVKVAERIAARQKALGAATELSQERIRQELATLGFSSLPHYVIDDNGDVTLAPGAPPSAIRAVSSVKRKRRVIPQGEGVDPIVEIETTFRLWDKPAALRLGGQHLGMYKDGIDFTSGGQPIKNLASVKVVLVPAPKSADDADG